MIKGKTMANDTLRKQQQWEDSIPAGLRGKWRETTESWSLGFFGKDPGSNILYTHSEKHLLKQSFTELRELPEKLSNKAKAF